ncbi:hypothetical protein ACFSVJ_00225 [Prauserella oleivorans]
MDESRVGRREEQELREVGAGDREPAAHIAADSAPHRLTGGSTVRERGGSTMVQSSPLHRTTSSIASMSANW